MICNKPEINLINLRKKTTRFEKYNKSRQILKLLFFWENFTKYKIKTKLKYKNQLHRPFLLPFLLVFSQSLEQKHCLSKPSFLLEVHYLEYPKVSTTWISHWFIPSLIFSIFTSSNQIVSSNRRIFNLNSSTYSINFKDKPI